MANLTGTRRRRVYLAAVATIIVAAVPLLTVARHSAISIGISNNSSREIRNVFLSPVNSDDWSSNQLPSSLGSGQSVTLNGVACGQQEIKVIAEDQDGCFTSTVVSCSANASWTIANDSPRDCGN